jgi:hypothetical protein
MANGRFRIFRGPRSRIKGVDADKHDGTGEALRECFNIDDEGDEQIRNLLRRIDENDRAGG